MTTATASPAISIPVRVYIEDTDAGQIVYYINYLKFIERARTELLRKVGFSKTAIFDTEQMFVVHSAQIKYLSPATLDDLLDVTAKVVECGRSFLVFEQTVSRDGALLFEASVKVACVDQHTMKPRRVSKGMIAALTVC